MQKLRNDSGSGLVTIPKGFLEQDDVLEDGEVPTELQLNVERLGRRAYVVRLTEDGQLPDLQNCEEIERLAAQRLLDENVFGQRPRAD